MDCSFQQVLSRTEQHTSLWSPGQMCLVMPVWVASAIDETWCLVLIPAMFGLLWEHTTTLSLTSLEILGQRVPLSEVNLVFYDLNEISQSELISRKHPYVKEKDHANDVVPYFIHCVQIDAKEEKWTTLVAALGNSEALPCSVMDAHVSLWGPPLFSQESSWLLQQFPAANPPPYLSNQKDPGRCQSWQK